jgi:Zn-dependent protease with chaperone function
VLSTLWSLIKVSFNKRLFLYEFGVLTFAFSGSFPNLLVRFFCIFACLTAYILLTPFLTSTFAWQLKTLFIKKYEADENLKNEVRRIANQLGVKIKKIYIAKGLYNAYVRLGTLVLGEELLNRFGYHENLKNTHHSISTDTLNNPQIMAVIAHELGHIKEKHIWFRMIATMTLLGLPLWTWQRLYWPIIINEIFTQLMLVVMINVTLLIYSIVVNIPLSWYSEVRADRIAVQIAGKAATVSALLAIVDKEKFKLSSEDHPAISERVKLILKYRP